MNKIVSFFSGLLIGALTGAVIAILYAPMSGESLREETQERANKLFDDIKATVAEERKKLETELEALKRGEIQLS